MFLFRNSVRSAVVRVINERIKVAEKSYKYSLRNLVRETAEKIKVIQSEHKAKQQRLLDEGVESVINPSYGVAK